jgi:hypothetical protein
VLAFALISFASVALKPRAVIYADSSDGKNQTGAARTYAKKTSDDNSQVFETVVKPMIRQNCASCHNPIKLKGDLDLEQFLSQPSQKALKSREIFELLVQKLGAGEMPPPGMAKPSTEQIQTATTWIQRQYALLDAKTAPDPGRVTARRLNRYEYNNSIRDLVAVNLRFSNDFPPDPYGYGFDNIGDVLTLSPMLTEMYLKAAERVAEAAIPTDAPQQGLSVRYESQALGQQSHMHVQVTHDFPVDGLYNLRVGWEQGIGKGTHLTCHIWIDGKEVLKQPIIFSTTQDRAFYAKNVAIRQGSHLFETQMEVDPGFKGRLPYPAVLEVFGPFHPVPREQTASYRRIFFKGPPAHEGQAEYNRQILSRLARRAYRRPVTTKDIQPLLHLTQMVRSHGGSFEEGIQVALEAILMSPDFLFRIERDPPGMTAHHVSDVELASRLSYFLWSSLPDDQLLAVAEAQTLHNPAVLHSQVMRMLADPRADSLATNFGGEWLQTRNLQFQKPDSQSFPEYDVELEDAMRTETEMFFENIRSSDASILDFIDGKYSFLNERMAKLYGIPGIEGREFRRVDLDGTQRSGVITQASVLTASSYPTRTSPVIRGKWVLENILNTPPPPPPANVPALDDHDLGLSTSVRQRLERHRDNPVCAGCHARMDPIGFGLENYDAIGRYRTVEGQLPIDSSGTLPDGRKFTGAAQLKQILRADSPKFAHGFTEKMLTYALGRGLEPYDRAAVDKITQQVVQDNYRFSAVVLGIVNSVPFQMRESESGKPDATVTAGVEERVHSASASIGE